MTEVTNTDDVIGLMKRNEAWQAKSNLRQEHVKLVRRQAAAQARLKTVVMTHLSPSSETATPA
jgi:hypothetical protein